MTGGSDQGFRANTNLARAAQQLGLPVGMGSFRVLFEHDEVFEHFHLKAVAPDVPVLGNLGGVQIRDLPHPKIVELGRRLELDAMVIHLNPGQELFQPDGDRDFRGIREAIGRFCEASPIPVIVKETGFGVAPSLVEDLLGLGVRYVDLAGAGGTNWVSVEGYRGDAGLEADAAEFATWGLPTALLLAAIRARYGRACDGKILSSGGVRSGQDLAKSIALGAVCAGTALPLIRAEAEAGVDGVVAYLESMMRTLRAVMVLTGSRSPENLRSAPLRVRPSFAAEVDSLARIDSSTGVE